MCDENFGVTGRQALGALAQPREFRAPRLQIAGGLQLRRGVAHLRTDITAARLVAPFDLPLAGDERVPDCSALRTNAAVFLGRRHGRGLYLRKNRLINNAIM